MPARPVDGLASGAPKLPDGFGASCQPVEAVEQVIAEAPVGFVELGHRLEAARHGRDEQTLGGSLDPEELGGVGCGLPFRLLSAGAATEADQILSAPEDEAVGLCDVGPCGAEERCAPTRPA